MLHVLPALILLLMQGPAALNRAALGDRLPEVLYVLAESRLGHDPDASVDGDAEPNDSIIAKSGDVAWVVATWLAFQPLDESSASKIDLTREAHETHSRIESPPIPIGWEMNCARLHPTRAGP